LKLFFYIIFLSTIWATGESDSEPLQRGLKVPARPAVPDEEKLIPVPKKPQDKEEDKAKVDTGKDEKDHIDKQDDKQKEKENKVPIPAKKKVSYTIKKQGPINVKILQISNSRMRKYYPYGLRTLLEHVNDTSSVKLESIPETTDSFEDKAIFNYPFIYMNADDRPNWEFSDLEVENIRDYLDRGGFIYIDAGISAAFLRNSVQSQRHSFADWEASPRVKKAFKQVYPAKKFQRLKRNHQIYKSFYKGLPDPKDLSESVREYVVKEKWPQGTYSAVGLKVNGRIAVLCTPIIAMGWGKNSEGAWATTIGFRIREKAKNLGEILSKAQTAQQYETTREDGQKDIVYCLTPGLPDWVKEPSNRYRVFNYYHSLEISQFAHRFYTQLGLNILIYSLTH